MNSKKDNLDNRCSVFLGKLSKIEQQINSCFGKLFRIEKQQIVCCFWESFQKWTTDKQLFWESFQKTTPILAQKGQQIVCVSNFFSNKISLYSYNNRLSVVLYNHTYLHLFWPILDKKRTTDSIKDLLWICCNEMQEI